MFGGMLIRRTVTAECRTALLTRPQMHPTRTDLDAFLANTTRGLLDVSDRVDVSA